MHFIQLRNLHMKLYLHIKWSRCSSFQSLELVLYEDSFSVAWKSWRRWEMAECRYLRWLPWKKNFLSFLQTLSKVFPKVKSVHGRCEAKCCKLFSSLPFRLQGFQLKGLNHFFSYFESFLFNSTNIRKKINLKFVVKIKIDKTWFGQRRNTAEEYDDRVQLVSIK